MRKLLMCLGILGAAHASTDTFASLSLPDNPIAMPNCTAKVKVDAARLRTGPSLEAKIVGVRVQDEPLHVIKVVGKWVQVETAAGDTAFMAAYLLTFPAGELLEQWKKENPSPSVGKKAKVKWAAVQFRKYPSSKAAVLGHFNHNDEVAVLNDLGNGWSLVESRKADGSGTCFGFIANRALAAPDVPDPPYWSAPLAKVHLKPGQRMEVEPVVESPSQYCQRTAWTPELFVLELKAKSHRLDGQPGFDQMVAVR